MRFGFAGAGFVSESRQANDQRTVNFYPEIADTPSRNNVILYRTPGLTSFITGLSGKCRGLFALNGHIFAVMGGHVYDIVSGGTSSDLGAIADDGLPVSMAANPETLFIVSAGLGYRVFGGVLSQITDPDFPSGALYSAYLDGYFLVIATSGITSALYWSAIDDASSWDALDFIEVQASANALVSMIVMNQQILLFGNQITQPFYDTGGDPPWAPIPGTTIDQGCAARFSPVLLDNACFFLGSDRRGDCVVWKLQGVTPVRVSNHDIENAMQRYATVSDAIAYGFQENGHQFYQLTFPTAGATWRYDTTTGLWHEALRWDTVIGQFEAHLTEHHCFEFGKHIVGDRRTGTLYEMGRSLLTDDGEQIHRLRRAPHLYDAEDNFLVQYRSFELVAQVGIGLSVASTAIGYNPLVTLRWSDDGGYTWSNDHTASAGRLGKYKTRIHWHRLGKARSSRVFECRVSDPVDWVFMDGLVDVKRGKS